MTNYYTNVACVGNNILYRGVKDGRRIKLKIGYSPTLFLPSNKSTRFKNLQGEFLEPMKFENIRDAKDFVKRYDQVQNFNIYGNDRFEYAYIAEEFKGQIDWDINHIDVAFMDIEVGGGQFANQPDKKLKIRKK